MNKKTRKEEKLGERMQDSQGKDLSRARHNAPMLHDSQGSGRPPDPVKGKSKKGGFGGQCKKERVSSRTRGGEGTSHHPIYP